MDTNNNVNNLVVDDGVVNTGTIKKFFEDNLFGLFTSYIVQEVNSFLDHDGIEPSLILAAMQEAVAVSAQYKWKYATKILTENSQKGIITLEKFKQEKANREKEKELREAQRQQQQQTRFTGKVRIQDTINYRD